MVINLREFSILLLWVPIYDRHWRRSPQITPSVATGPRDPHPGVHQFLESELSAPEMLEAFAPLYRNSAMCARGGVGEHRPLSDKKIARPVEHEHALAAQRSPPARSALMAGKRPRRSPRHRRRIFLPIHEWLHVGRWDEAHRMPQPAKLPRPIVRRCARFHADQNRRQLRELWTGAACDERLCSRPRRRHGPGRLALRDQTRSSQPAWRMAPLNGRSATSAVWHTDAVSGGRPPHQVSGARYPVKEALAQPRR